MNEFLDRLRSLLHRGIVAFSRSCCLQLFRKIVAVKRGEFLFELNTTAMAMHVAKAANIHQDIETESLSGVKGAQQFIMLAAMAQSEINDLAAPCFSGRSDCFAPLPVGVMAMLINERRREFDFEVILI